ncbi:unnamed protein product [Rotaria socialis]|uniref:Uncharacterized protein n=1 Tax=Rotaria socialis TaxID=392032 RepID=A0A821TIV1_9BILA|nr:unnamed protein product [Rotaria socialis]CAF4556896.1 unnamed protein product [Rotaria socialis]CAF4875060.1 unnamed protein product [Rotaria socialis]
MFKNNTLMTGLRYLSTTKLIINLSRSSKFNKSIDYLNSRPEYIRVIIIEWPTKSSIPVVHIVSADIQCSLLSARRCENFDDYSQQVDWSKLSVR